ncbi:hypothetical protein IGB42_00429 [Andreprevotia sp. IGB-42]|nr:hypothetical protein IGB42_00429 [Andreprevotia sp. IGB-42]
MELVIFIGGQGAGKSTYYKSHFFDTHLRINMDMLNTRHREHLLLQACMAMKQRCVIDKINATVAEREKYIRLAHAHHFKVIGYYFDSPIEDLLRRNSQRSGKANIPEIGIRGTLKKLVAPAFAEGFDEIHHVATLDGGLFHTVSMKHEV